MAGFIQPLQQQQSAVSALLTAPRLVMLTMERACKDNTRDTVRFYIFASNSAVVSARNISIQIQNVIRDAMCKPVLSCIVQARIVLYCASLYCPILCKPVLSCIVQARIVLYCASPYCPVLCKPVLSCITLTVRVVHSCAARLQS